MTTEKNISHNFELRQYENSYNMCMMEITPQFGLSPGLVTLVVDELTLWSKQGRRGYNSWLWYKKSDAEKFIMYFKLKYPEYFI